MSFSFWMEYFVNRNYRAHIPIKKND